MKKLLIALPFVFASLNLGAFPAPSNEVLKAAMNHADVKKEMSKGIKKAIHIQMVQTVSDEVMTLCQEFSRSGSHVQVTFENYDSANTEMYLSTPYQPKDLKVCR